MGSPLSPVIANYYMENFEANFLKTTNQKPSKWFRYVDDTFVIWPHGKPNLDVFLQQLNSQHPNIRFTMEIENDGKLPFLDVMVMKTETGALERTVYRKPTHTDRYLNAYSNHHPAQKRTVIKSLMNRALEIAQEKYRPQEIQHVTTALLKNGFTKQEILRASRPSKKQPARDQEQPTTTAYLPYVKNTTDRIAKILKKNGIKTTFTTTTKLSQLLTSNKDKLDPLLTTGIYKVPCECGSVYVGMTNRSIKTRITEHKRHTRLQQPDRSAVAQHSLENNHTINFEQVEILAKERGFYNLSRREAVEIEQHPNNFNRDNGYKLSNIWKQVLKNKQQRCGITHNNAI